MYTMKETCEKADISYETLKYYCNQELIPNVKRNSQNHRIFSENNIQWLIGIRCLKDCGLTHKEMKVYLQLCIDGQKTIPERKEILKYKRELLESEKQKINDNIQYLDDKLKYYDNVLKGTQEYTTNIEID